MHMYQNPVLDWAINGTGQAPSLAKAKARAQGSACSSNFRQLQICAQLYADDNLDVLAPNEAFLSVGGGGREAWNIRATSWLQGNAYTDTNSSCNAVSNTDANTNTDC